MSQISNTTPATQNSIPHTADLHQMPRLPRKMALSRCPTPATQFALCHHFAQLWQCNSQKTRNTTRLKCSCHTKWPGSLAKCCAWKEKCNSSTGKRRKSIAARHTERLTVGHVETCGNVTKRHACSTRNDATRRFKPPKVTILPSLRTSAEVANGSDPQSKTRTLRYAFGKKSTQ